VRGPGNGGTVTEDGAFGFRDVEPDVFHVNVGLPDELYLKSVSWSTADVMESGLDLSAGAPGTDLEIVVSANGGQIDGKVEDEDSDPVDHALVTLVPPGARRNRNFFKSVRTTPDGHFTFTGVAPGTYKLLAWDDVDVNAVLYDPDFLRPFETAGQSIQIVEGARQSATLKLIVKPPE
ncbi:MAG TPA: carboxypeptidase-like regulatory domain-containing protein, partial [Candidatus Solibacter sp.]|nr:carboxypeptidase-like regulatory domain-containing protein [Candidatus Solibacter sp.]